MENIHAEADILTWWLMIKFPDQGKWEMAGIYMAIFNVSSRAYLAKSPEMRARLILTTPPPHWQTPVRYYLRQNVSLHEVTNLTLGASPATTTRSLTPAQAGYLDNKSKGLMCPGHQKA